MFIGKLTSFFYQRFLLLIQTIHFYSPFLHNFEVERECNTLLQGVNQR
jgi:hypothetical protein